MTNREKNLIEYCDKRIILIESKLKTILLSYFGFSAFGKLARKEYLKEINQYKKARNKILKKYNL